MTTDLTEAISPTQAHRVTVTADLSFLGIELCQIYGVNFGAPSRHRLRLSYHDHTPLKRLVQNTTRTKCGMLPSSYGGWHRESCDKALTLFSEGGPRLGCRALSEESWHVAGLTVPTSVPVDHVQKPQRDAGLARSIIASGIFARLLAFSLPDTRPRGVPRWLLIHLCTFSSSK